MKKILIAAFGLSAPLLLSACTDLQQVDGTTPLGGTTIITPGTSTTTSTGATTVTPITTNTSGQMVFPANGSISQQVQIQQPGVAPINTQVFSTGGGQAVPGQVYITADGRVIVYDPQQLPLVNESFATTPVNTSGVFYSGGN